MRGMTIALALLLQAAELPPAYPRPGTTKLFENERVHVLWEFLHPPAPAPHRHQRHTIVAFTRRTPKVTFVTRGTVHNDEAAAEADRLYAVELK